VEQSPSGDTVMVHSRKSMTVLLRGHLVARLERIAKERGLSVTAIDICPDAVEIMKCRGVTDARCVNVYKFDGNRFDTLLMLGHGIGMAETIAGLDRYLLHARTLLNDGGQVLLERGTGSKHPRGSQNCSKTDRLRRPGHLR